MELVIASGVMAQIRAHAAGAPASEVCGLLLSDDAGRVAAVAAANVHPDPSRFFELDPAALLAAHRRQRDGGQRVIGHYHSHPGGLAEPSAQDAAAADITSGWIWLIVADGQAAAFQVVPGGALHGVFERVTMAIID